jgi:predicted metal-binding protein
MMDRTETAPWSDIVLVCAKCAAKAGRGHKGKTELRSELKRALKRRGLGDSIRVVDCSCLDLCPKDGQTVASGRQLAEGRLLVVDPEASGEQVAALLFGGKA